MWNGVEKVWDFQKVTKVSECKVLVGRPSQCIYRMIQDFLAHGIDPWFFIVYGIYPWVLTHSLFRIFWSFLGEWGLCCNKFPASLYL